MPPSAAAVVRRSIKKLKRKQLKVTALELHAATATADDDDDNDDMFALGLPAPTASSLSAEVVSARKLLNAPAPVPTAQEDGTVDLLRNVLARASNAELAPIDMLHPIDARRQKTLSMLEIKQAKIARKEERAAANKNAAAVLDGEADNRLWNRRKVEALPRKPKKHGVAR